MITIYGASDDLIEVEGDITEEFTYTDRKEGDYLAFSDGTLLLIRYDEAGRWRITPIYRGSGQVSVQQVAEDDDEYTDRASIDAEIRWVVQGLTYLGTR